MNITTTLTSKAGVVVASSLLKNKNMHIIELQGGIGNQLFQLSHGLFVAPNPSQILLNSAYQAFIPNRSFALEGLGFRLPRISWFNHPLEYLLGVPKLGQNITPLYQKVGAYTIYEEKTPFEFTANLPTQTNLYVRGFWQNYRYVTKILPFFRKIVSSFGFSAPAKQMLDKISKHQSVAIHVRRGDYLKLGGFEVLDESYYQTAISLIKNQIPNPHFYIFTEDQAWANKHLAIKQATYVTSSQSDLEDLLIMAQCQHHIIANSTYSWWGSQLSASKGITVAPKNWTGQTNSARALLLPTWQTI